MPLAVWRIRLQALNVKPLTALMVGLGRAKSDGYDAQAYKNSSKLYAQEIAVDSLRYFLNELELITLARPLIA